MRNRTPPDPIDAELVHDIPLVRRSVFVFPVVLIVLAGFIVLALNRAIFVFVLPGELGVRYDPFFGGTQTTKVYGEGLVVKYPWDRFYTYEMRLQNSKHSMRALSSEGMSFDITLSVLYRPKATTLGTLHSELGPDYQKRVVEPIVVSTVRETFSRYNSHAVYTVNFSELQNEIAAALRETAVDDLVEFTSVLIERLELPAKVRAAIEHKLEQEQVAQSYAFVLETARAEAERQRIEAIGIQNFYSVVSSALTDELLTWRGIEATLQLAQSNNAKIVVVGNGEGQLPLILGGEIGSLPDAPPPQIDPVPGNASPLQFEALEPIFPELSSEILTRDFYTRRADDGR